MRIRVKTPSRLHLSLIDLEGSLGRVDGGIGLALERPNVILEAEAYDGLKSNDGVAKQFAGKVLGSYDLEGASIQVKERIPEHVGLGGTTQMALAVALAVTRAHDIDADTRELARTV
ncbi:MAG: DUF98 domain-containing protein, partial [Candidatus Altiarchaeota archaeon]|nr:DUF98 domain-containing protein [Candidatus Altiarchaeota archaeon]